MSKVTAMGKSKSQGVKAGTAIKAGGGGMLHGTQKTGAQKPGVTGTSKSGGNNAFSASPGRGGMLHGTQKTAPARAGATVKGGAGGGAGGGKKRGYGGDANGNPY